MKRLQWIMLFIVSCAVTAEVVQDVAGINDAIENVTKARMWADGSEESRSPDESILIGETSGEATTPAGTCLKETMTSTITANTCTTNNTNTCEGTEGSLEQLREQMMTLTNKLSIQVAAWNIAQQLQRKWELLEREKASYVQESTDNVLRLVEIKRHNADAMNSDAGRERQTQQRLLQGYQTLNRYGRRLQVIRRLLAGAHVGLMHMESNKKLCDSDLRKRLQKKLQ